MQIPSREEMLTGLTVDQQRILWAVVNLEETTSYSLSRREELGIESARAAQLLRTLLDKGLVVCREIKTIGRGKIIYTATEKGISVNSAYQTARKLVKELDQASL